MIFNVFLIAVTLWTTSANGNFQFPVPSRPIPFQGSPNSNQNQTLLRSQKTSNNRQSSSDRINFMDDITDQSNIPESALDAQVAAGVLKMALQLDRAISPEGKKLYNENVLFSPTSIAVALALVLLGSGGQTYEEVSRVLGLQGRRTGAELNAIHNTIGEILAMVDQNQGSSSPTLTTIATGIFVQKDYPIKDRFQRISQGVYKSDVIPLDFVANNAHAGDTINRWVEWKTQGLIKGFLSSPPEPATKVLLVSALYFNGKWEHPFPIVNTRRRPFYISSPESNNTDQIVQVMMMANAAELPFYNDPILGCKIVSLPYLGKQVALHIVLPNARGYDELMRLKHRITAPILESLISNTRVTSTIISLPRMKLESSFSLRSALEVMGVKSLFDPELSNLSQLSSGIKNNNTSNDLFTFSTRLGSDNTTPDNTLVSNTNLPSSSRQQIQERQRGSNVDPANRRSSQNNLDKNPGLYADDVYHKVELEVSETGTVGAAVTAVTISRDGSHRVVRLDRPFLFFIRHASSKMILFWGTVSNPT